MVRRRSNALGRVAARVDDVVPCARRKAIEIVRAVAVDDFHVGTVRAFGQAAIEERDGVTALHEHVGDVATEKSATADDESPRAYTLTSIVLPRPSTGATAGRGGCKDAYVGALTDAFRSRRYSEAGINLGALNRRCLLLPKFVKATAFALGIVLIGLPVYAADSMTATPACSSDALHSAMMSMSKKLAAVKLSGSPDKDYAEAINSMMESEQMLNSWEMKCGKNAKLMKMAGDMHKNTSAMMTQVSTLGLGG